jgi:hypothetical protein
MYAYIFMYNDLLVNPFHQQRLVIKMDVYSLLYFSNSGQKSLRRYAYIQPDDDGDDVYLIKSQRKVLQNLFST